MNAIEREKNIISVLVRLLEHQNNVKIEYEIVPKKREQDKDKTA